MPGNRYSESMVSLAMGYSEKPPKSAAGPDVPTDDVAGMAEALRNLLPDQTSQSTYGPFPRSLEVIAQEALVPPYSKKPFYGPFTATDFQIGSVRLSTPPIAVSVERLRDVQVSLVLRGQAVASKASASVVQLTLTLDFPDPYVVDEELKPLIAELKTCPFTKLRSYDMAVKLSAIDGFGISDQTRQAQLNVMQAELSKARIRSLVSPLVGALKREDGQFVQGQQWQDRVIREVDNLIADVSDRNFSTQSSEELAMILLTRISSTIRAHSTAIITSLGYKAYEKIAKEWTATPGAVRNVEAGSEESDPAGSEFPKELQAKYRIATTLFKDLTDAIQSEAALEKESTNTTEELPLMDGFIPVVCQQMVFSAIPGRAGAFRVNLTFEYFFHDNYVTKMQYHSFNDRTGWDVSEDPAEADLLLRWRDIQYLGEDDSGIAASGVGSATHDEILEYLNERDEEGTPGFLKAMQRARFSRVSRAFPSDPTQHKLSVFYPQNMPKITSNAHGSNTGAVYKGITIDNGDADTDGIISNTQVVWNFNVARHVDEHGGVVRHQWSGGASLSVSFEICVPMDGLPENIVEGGRILIGDHIDSDDTNSYARLVGRLNNMFGVMEQNRKLLPSDAFLPTTVFVENPITALFGAYTFELRDIPMFQSEPGKVTTVLNLVESMPVIGMAGSPDLANQLPTTAIKPVRNIDSGAKFKGIIEGAKQGSKTAHDYLRKLMEIMAEQIYNAYHGDVERPALVYNEEGEVVDTLNETGSIIKLLELAKARYESRTGEEFGELTDRISGYYANKDPIITNLGDALSYLVLGLPTPPQLIRFPRKVIALLKLSPGILEELLVDDEFASQILPEESARALTAVVYSLSNDTDAMSAVLAASGIAVPTGTDLSEFVLQNDFKDPSTDVLTRQLYPDMILPRYFQVLGIDPDTELSDELLLKWIPSMSETGKLDFGSNGDTIPSRSLRDIADPDVYFARERTVFQKAEEYGFDLEQKGPDGDPNTVVNEAFSAVQDDDSLALRGQSSYASRDSLVTNSVDGKDSELSSGWAELERKLAPNDRRMLYAFPTYSLEFFLDIQHTKFNSRQGIAVPGETSHFEARLLNVLPMIDIEVYEDAGDRPNIASLVFIARRAGLRNNSWMFLPPKNEETIYDEKGRLRFTNNVDKVKQHLNQNSTSYRSDPMFLTTKLLVNGTRAVLKLGYGTDLNNPRMLPQKICGSIAEVSLGEISQMVIQSFGTQLANPLNTEIGGSGRYSPNKVLSGALTMRAFSDIFHALDMRYMGRTGRGIDIDARSLSNADLERIALITYQTRTALNSVASSALSFVRVYSDAPDTWYNNVNPLVLGARKLNELLESGGGNPNRDFLGDVSTGYLNPYKNFYPEFLNVKGPAIAISDWAISNTSTQNLTAATWIEMITNLNPGTIWWPHTYGDEVRLFWGRPEAIFRADPGQLNPELSALTLQFMRTQVKTSSKDIFHTIRARIERDRYSALLKNENGQVVSWISPGKLKDLANPFQKRTIKDHIDFLLAQGLTAEAVATLIRKVMEAKVFDIQQAQQFLSEVSAAGGPSGTSFVTQGNDQIQLNDYLKNILTNSYNTIDFYVLSANDGGDVKVPVDRTSARSRAIGGSSFALEMVGQGLKQDTVYNTWFGGDDSFLTLLSNIGDREWNELNDDYLAILPIGTTSVELYSRVGTKRTKQNINFNALYLKTLRFLLEKTIEDLNYMYRDSSPDAPERILHDDLSSQMKTAGIASRKALRAMRLNGYRPFRNSHFVLSGQKLMSSHLEATQAYMANSISYDGYTVGYNVLPEERRVMDLDSEMMKLNFGAFEWFKGLVGKNERDRVVDALFPSLLAKGLCKMYRGELMMIGDPWIKPHDIIYMLDLHNGIYGPVGCETVINKFSVQNGLVTVVRPRAITQAQSSRFLTDHLVQQRLLKSLTGALIIGGIAAAFIPGVGIPIAAGLGTAAALTAGVGEVLDTYGRLRLNNVASTDPIHKSLIDGRGASARSVEDIVNTIMVESYVSGSGLKATGMAQDRDQLLKRIKDAADELKASQLGVSMIPLKRLATHTPLLAGLRTSGFDTIEVPDAGQIIDEGVRPLQTVEQAYTDMKIMFRDTIQDFNTGLFYIHKSVEARAKAVERLRKLFRDRGIEVEE